jgi:hypothetical protein
MLDGSFIAVVGHAPTQECAAFLFGDVPCAVAALVDRRAVTAGTIPRAPPAGMTANVPRSATKNTSQPFFARRP